MNILDLINQVIGPSWIGAALGCPLLVVSAMLLFPGAFRRRK